MLLHTLSGLVLDEEPNPCAYPWIPTVSIHVNFCLNHQLKCPSSNHGIRWRHVIPLLPPDAPLFVPDLPGYGASAPLGKNDKFSVGTAVLEALKEQVKQAGVKEAGNVEVVLIGHDRGARVAHHLTVSGVSGIKILGVCLIDIVRSLSVSPCNLEHRKLKRHRSPPQHNGSTLSLLLLRQRK